MQGEDSLFGKYGIRFGSLLAGLVGLALVMGGCTPEAPEIDLDYSDDFAANSGYWEVNNALEFYGQISANVNDTTAGALTMWATPNTTGYSGTYTGMVGMIYSTAAAADTRWTMSVDASFVNRPVSTVAANQAEIVLFFNMADKGTFDCLFIRSDGTWDLRSYVDLEERNSEDDEYYHPVIAAVLPEGAFNADGTNAIVITQDYRTIAISVNGVALTTPDFWPYGGYNNDVGFGLGFKYESRVPVTTDGTVPGPKVVFDNFHAAEYE